MTLLLRYLLGLIGLGGRAGDVTPDPADNNRGLALATGVTPEGLPIFARMRGKCGSLIEGNRRIGLITGVTSEGLPVVAWSDQRCKPGTERFEEGNRYLGVVSGVTPEGIPIISSWCERCNCRDLCTIHGGTDDAPAGITYTNAAGFGPFSNASSVAHLRHLNFTCISPYGLKPGYGFGNATIASDIMCDAFNTLLTEEWGWFYSEIGDAYRFKESAVPESLDPLLIIFQGTYQNTSPASASPGNAYSAAHGGEDYEIIFVGP